MAAATLIVYLQSQLASNDALFLFISNNLVINILMVGLAAYTVWLSFLRKFTSRYVYGMTVAASFSLALLGIAGILSASLDRYMFDVIKPLNYVMILEAAVIMGICALSYKHPALSINLRLPRAQINHLRQLAGNLDLGSYIPNGTSGRSKPSAA